MDSLLPSPSLTVTMYVPVGSPVANHVYVPLNLELSIILPAASWISRTEVLENPLPVITTEE